MTQTTKFLQKLFHSLDSRIILPFSLIAYYLTKVAKSNTYVETFSKHADTLHRWIGLIYEEDLKHTFELLVRDTLRKLNIRAAELAFDITHEPFYGKTRTLHIFNVNRKKYPYGGQFQFITCSLINHGKQIPLMALPVRHGEQVKLCIDLLRYCQSLKFRIKFCLFDRGFYTAELIDFLEAQKLKYLMLVPVRKGILKDFFEKTISFAKMIHQLKYSKNKSTWKQKTNIIVCKDIADFDWMFASNIQFDNPIDYVMLYKRRWQIETNYRVEDEAKIKSKSSNYLIRYFYFMVSCTFRLLWVVQKNISYYVPFKRYLDIIENKLLYRFLGIKGV